MKVVVTAKRLVIIESVRNRGVYCFFGGKEK